jgi:hypothetical protein
MFLHMILPHPLTYSLQTEISDPDAKKPDDWDESQPKTVADPEETKPEDWYRGAPLVTLRAHPQSSKG